MKKFLALLSALLICGSLFAAEVDFDFGTVDSEKVMITSNTSQSKTDVKKVVVNEKGIAFIRDIDFSNVASSTYITFIEPLLVENVSNFKAMKLSYESFGYVTDIILHFESYDGEKIVRVGTTDIYYGPHDLEWTNPLYIEDVNDREVSLKPIYPFSVTNLYLRAIEFHIDPIFGYDYNVQRISKLSIIYDKAVQDNSQVDDLENIFGINSERNNIIEAKNEKLKAAKQLAQDREKALMATESFSE